MLAAWLSACAGGSGGRVSGSASGGGAGAPPADSATGDGARATNGGLGIGFGGAPDGGGASGGGDGPLGGPGGVDAAPTVQQSLFDFTQTGIAPWGPVVDTFQVPVSRQVHTVKQLSSTNPFLATYQLENGDIVWTNKPLVDVVSFNGQDAPRQLESWTEGPDTYQVCSRELIVSFKPEATEQDIAGIIAASNLFVEWADYEPPTAPEQGNDIAVFHFSYPLGQWASLSAALQYFQQQVLVEEACPNYADAIDMAYQGGNPTDSYFVNNECRYANVLGAVASNEVNWGPPFGQWISSEVAAAVIDNGVARASQDFGIPGYPTNWKKISWCGISAYSKGYIRAGYMQGEATLTSASRYPAKVTHGTNCAGTITACTNSLTVGTVGLAPQIGVVPLRYFSTYINGKEEPYLDSVLGCYAAMKDILFHGAWVEDVRVVNGSIETAKDNGFWHKIINRDLVRNDRLYVSAAGNHNADRLAYPAIWDVVLGVSGLWSDSQGGWFPYRTAANGPEGSSWQADANLQDTLRKYPVSGIYGFCLSHRSTYRSWSYVPASPKSGLSPDHYIDFVGTSFAAPQVTALAALLYL